MDSKVTFKGNELTVRFTHTRNYDDCGDMSAKGGITEVHVWLDEFTVLSSFAVCSKKDTFCRKVGATLALQRLQEKVSSLA